MAVNVTESLFEELLEYLRVKTATNDQVAQNLLNTLENLSPSSASTDSSVFGTATNPERRKAKAMPSQFGQKLFDMWKELADLQVGENYWSYPVMFEDLAEAMEISIDNFVESLATVQIGSLQLIQGRGYNYLINGQQSASLTFHSAPTLKKAAIPNLTDKKQYSEQKPANKVFKVGDRVCVNANRQQYANHTGVIEQVISVSCRVKLDNGWTAFLPNHCLDYAPIPTEK
jgi:hypothetical protein